MDQENILNQEQGEITALKDIVKNLPGNSFVMIEPESGYDSSNVDSLLNDRGELDAFLTEMSEIYSFDSSAPLVLSAGVFRSGNVMNQERREDLILNCFSEEGGWRLSLKLLYGSANNAVLFFKNKTMDAYDEIPMTTSTSELFLRVKDILLSTLRNPRRSNYKIL